MLEDLRSIVATLVPPDEVRDLITSRVNDSLSLAAAGEPKVALENLCDNLFEFDVPLKTEAKRRLADLCSRFLVDESRISLLDELVSPDVLSDNADGLPNPDKELCRCVQSLAQPASVQLRLFPEFVVVGDELALAFDDALRRFRPQSPILTPAQGASLAQLDEYLTALSGSQDEALWSNRASLADDPRWERVRTLARAVLVAFNWPDQVPERDGAIYVASGNVTRNA